MTFVLPHFIFIQLRQKSDFVIGYNIVFYRFFASSNEPCIQATDVEVNKYMRANYPPGYTYQQFGPQFRAEFFNASGFC
jgi:hypothetical protein